MQNISIEISFYSKLSGFSHKIVLLLLALNKKKRKKNIDSLQYFAKQNLHSTISF